MCSESFDYGVILSVARIDAPGEYGNHVRFGMDGIYPSVSRAVLYEGNIIVGFAEGYFREFSAKLGVN